MDGSQVSILHEYALVEIPVSGRVLASRERMTSGNAVSTGEFDNLIQHLQSRAVLTPLAAQEGRMARVSSAEQDARFTLFPGATPGARSMPKPLHMPRSPGAATRPGLAACALRRNLI